MVWGEGYQICGQGLWVLRVLQCVGKFGKIKNSPIQILIMSLLGSTYRWCGGKNVDLGVQMMFQLPIAM